MGASSVVDPMPKLKVYRTSIGFHAREIIQLERERNEQRAKYEAAVRGYG